MTETLIKKFNQISKADIEIAGGKGASLGEMTQAGIPVPEGFVILSNAFDGFLEKTDLNIEIDAVLNTVDTKEVHTVENASEKIQAMVLSKEMPEDIKTEILRFYKNLDCKFVAVRSSATSEDSASAAWAGQLDSFLNTTKETLLENVKKCWASLFTPRAIFYRFEKKLNKDKISVAVVVQKMVGSKEAGIAFSVHPVTQDENQIIIEAGFGLGEAIVSGSITPDSYVVDKQGFSILDVNVNEQTKALYKKAKGGNKWKELGEKGKNQVLTEKEIIELSKLIVKIENHYGFPCDIEWAKEKGKFYIVQSRPITTLTEKGLKKTEEANIAKFIALNEINIQSANSNILIPDFVYNSYVDSKKFHGINYSPFFLFNIDGSKFNQLIPEKYIAQVGKSVGKKAITEKGYLQRIINEQLSIQEKIDKLWNTINLETNTTEKLIVSFKEFVKLAHRWWKYGVIGEDKGDYLGKLVIKKISKMRNASEEEVSAIVSKIAHPDELASFTKERIYFLKVCRLVLDKALSQKEALKNSEFIKFYKEYFKKYFYTKTDFRDRVVITFDLFIKDIYSEIKNKSSLDIESEIKKIQEENNKLSELKKETIKSAGLNKEEKRLISLVESTILWMDYRKEGMMKQFYYLSSLMHELAKRKKETYSTIEQLSLDEFLDFLEDRFKIDKNVIAKRKKVVFIIYRKGKKKEFIYEEEAKKLFSLVQGQHQSDEIKGNVASTAGKTEISGKARIVVDPVKDKFNDGEILIASMTRIEFVPLMKKASAIVTNEGGIACHAAIVSREMGVPCIIGTKNATKTIKNGSKITLDLETGKIHIKK